MALLAFVAFCFLTQEPVKLSDRQWPRSPRNTAIYASPSGAFKLTVTPTQPDGGGTTHYSMARDGREVWSKSLLYMVDDAKVTNDGSTSAHETYVVKNRDCLQKLLILSPAGDTKLDIDILRDVYPLHQSPEPRVVQIVASSEADTCVFRFKTNKTTVRMFKLSTGQEVADSLSKDLNQSDKLGVIRSLEYLPGTSLLLTSWRNFDGDPNDTTYKLFQPNGTMVWSRTIVGDADYREQLEHRNAYKQPDQASFHQLSTDSFVIRLFKSAKLLKFAITRNGDKVAVDQVDESPFVPPIQQKLNIATVSLHKLPSIFLKSPVQGKLPIVNTISNFCIIDKSRFAHVTASRDKIQVFNRVGKQLGLYAMPLTDDRGWKYIVYAGNDTVVAVSEHAMGGHNTEFWKLNIKTGVRKLIASKPNSYIKFLTSRQDGTFVYTASHLSNNDGESVIRMDLNGKIVFHHYQPNGYSGEPSEVLSAEAAVALADGSIAILENVGGRIVFFSSKDKYLRAIDLEKLLKSDSLYPTDLQVDDHGNLLFSEDDKIICVSPEGKILWKVAPKLDSGHSWKWEYRMLGSDIWVTDGFQLYLVGRDGTNKHKIGENVNQARLRNVDALAVTADGTVFARDERTNAVHIFDKTGKWLGSEPKPKEGAGFNNGFYFDGPNNVNIGSRGEEVLCIASDLKRTLRPPRENGRPPFEKRTDGRWFSSEYEINYSATGAAAIIDGLSFRAMEGGGDDELIEQYVSTYAPDRRALAMFRVPDDLIGSGLVGFDDKSVYLNHEGVIYCFDINGKPRWKSAKLDQYIQCLSGGKLFYANDDSSIGSYKLP